MRLLNTTTLHLESFFGRRKPRYAILSHTWEPDGEVLFEDLENSPVELYSSKSGFSKVQNACSQASQDGYKYVWIDTCCIDKSSSAELSEAINSMFRWYQESSICYAFLPDVAGGKDALSRSRWFTRGWTLQELIAPHEVNFYDSGWQFLGARSNLVQEIMKATGIQRQFLVRQKQTTLQKTLREASVAQRMSWASKRSTTRDEDMAYCLLGIFDVSMPLLYGEGTKAFLRLQEAIIYGSEDQSILAFRHPSPPSRGKMFGPGFSPVLAPDVRYFCDDIRREGEGKATVKMLKLKHGKLILEMYVVALTTGDWPWTHSRWDPSHVAFLDCVCGDETLSRPGIFLRRVGNQESNVFKRCCLDPVLGKVTIDSKTKLAVMGSGMFFNVPSLSHKNAHVRRLITIESDDAENRTFWTQTDPIILNYAGIQGQCSVGPAFPVLAGTDHQSKLFGPIGIVTFQYESEYFFVAWGALEYREPWCIIHSLKNFRSEDKLGITSGLPDEDAVKNVVQYIKEDRDQVQTLIQYFADLVWRSPRDFQVGTAQQLIIQHSWRPIDFIGRRAFEIKLVSRSKIQPQVTARMQLPPAKKSWAQRLRIRARSIDKHE